MPSPGISRLVQVQIAVAAVAALVAIVAGFQVKSTVSTKQQLEIEIDKAQIELAGIQQYAELVKKGDYDAAIKTDPDRALAWYLRGAKARQVGNLDSARDDLERAVALEPTLFSAHFDLAMVHLDKGRHREVVKEVETLVALDPSIRDLMWLSGGPSDLRRLAEAPGVRRAVLPR